MGVNGLNKFINEKHPDAVATVSLSHFSDTNLAIDASLLGYTFLYSCYRNSVKTTTDGPYLDLDSFYKAWFSRFDSLVRHLQKFNIQPIFVFDGPAPKEKDLTKEKRTASLDKQKQKVEEARLIWEQTPPLMRTGQQLFKYKTVYASIAVMPNQAFDRLRDHFEEHSIGWCKSKKEADHLCAALSQENIVSGVLSTDTDLLIHGVENVITTDIGKEGYHPETGEPLVKVIMREPLLASLGVDGDGLLHLGLLSGTDYNPGIYKVGPTKALQLVKAGNIPENINDMSLLHLKGLFAYEPSNDLIECSNLDF